MLLIRSYAFKFFSLILLFSACEKEPIKVQEPILPAAGPRLIFKFKFDSTQIRLNNFGQASTVPSNHRAQSPVFNSMAAHYIELATGDLTPLGAGQVLYIAPETNAGGSTAIDFSKSSVVGQNETFFSIPLNLVPSGSYKWLRVSLAYQNYDIRFKSGSYQGIGTIASFIGYNTYISKYKIKTAEISVNNDKLQGYWGFESTIPFLGVYTTTGQAPAGATTVVNPLAATSPIPAGSCVVTGFFVDNNNQSKNLIIDGSHTEDIVITVSLSTNRSFEWQENSSDNLFDPTEGDIVVDMGVRGMIPIIE